MKHIQAAANKTLATLGCGPLPCPLLESMSNLPDLYIYPSIRGFQYAANLDTDGFYRLDDPTHSIIDPVRQEAYRKSSDGVKNAGLAVTRSGAMCAMAGQE